MNRLSRVGMLLLAVGGLGGCATGGDKFACPNPTGVTCMNATDVYQATNNADHVTGVDPKLARKLSIEGLSTGGGVAPPAAPSSERLPAPAPAPSAAVQVPVGRPALVSPRCCNRPKAGLRVVGTTLAVAEPNARSVASLADAAVQARTAGNPDRLRVTSPLNAIPASGRRDAIAAYREEAKIMRIFISPWEDQQGDLHMSGYIFSEIAPRQWAVVKHDDGSDDGMLQLLAPPTPVPPVPAAMAGAGSAQPAASPAANLATDRWKAGSQNTQHAPPDSGEEQ